MGNRHECAIESQFGNALSELKIVKLPRYGAPIPLVLVEIKKRLHAVDALTKRHIFDISVKNSTASHHRTTRLFRKFFESLPKPLLDGVTLPPLLSVDRVDGFVAKVPQPTRSILRWTWDLMADVVEHRATNRMNEELLARSVAPSMCGADCDDKRRAHCVMFFKLGIAWTLRKRM